MSNTEQIVTVAFVVYNQPDNVSAQRWVIDNILTHYPTDHEWWIAQDNRIDDSDSDSTVFVPYSPEYDAVTAHNDRNEDGNV